MLSYAASCVPHDMQADLGWTSDLPAGRRAATTLRKLPIASPGTIETTARPTGTGYCGVFRKAIESWSLNVRYG